MTIYDLVSKYEADRDYFRSLKYNETQLRLDFLDPLFELLGWDINNTAGKSIAEREVFVEESLKSNAYEHAKKLCSIYGEVFRGGYIARGTKVLNRLPIRTIDFNDKVQKSYYNDIILCQKALIDIYTEMIIMPIMQEKLYLCDGNFPRSKIKWPVILNPSMVWVIKTPRFL